MTKSQALEVTLWGAVGPKGQVLKTSIGAFYAVAKRYAELNPGYHVIKLADVNLEIEGAAQDDPAPAREVVPKRTAAEVAEVLRRGPGRPRGTTRKAAPSNVHAVDFQRARRSRKDQVERM